MSKEDIIMEDVPMEDTSIENMPKLPKEISPDLLGIRIIYEPPSHLNLPKTPDIDIIAVHGLGANLATTWNAKRPIRVENHGKYVNWLSDPDMLPAVLPNARIMVFNYASQWYGKDATSLRFDRLATSFLRSMMNKRKSCPNRPLILIGHSLGGLVIEKALVHPTAIKEMVPAITAAILLGTPHAGTEHIGFPEIVERIIRYGVAVDLSLVQSLRPENEGILDTVNNFAEMANNEGISVDCFFETKASIIEKMIPGATAKAIIVNEKSAALRSWPCHPLALDHYSLNKFSSPEDGNWHVLRDVILQRGQEAPRKLQLRIVALEKRRSREQETIASFKCEAGNPRQNTISERYRETYTWIWSSRANGGPGFREWLLEDYLPNDATKRSVFWISGKPGAGKSTLMKYIFEDEKTYELLNKANGLSPVIIAGYFFHELGDASEKTLTGFLHSIIYQICSRFPILVQSIAHLYERQKDMNTNATGTIWPKSSLFKALRTLMTQDSVQGTFLLLVDGLDECQNFNDRDEGLEFLLELIELTDSKNFRLRAFISSRPLATIEDRLRRYPGFKIQEWTARDISKYVHSNLEKSLDLARHIVDQSLVKTLISGIVEQSLGVFIWVNLPEELQDLYTSIFEKINAEGCLEKALYYLQLIDNDLQVLNRVSHKSTTLLEVAFMDSEESIDSLIFKDMAESEQTKMCGRIEQRLKTHLRSLIEISPLTKHTVLQVPGNLEVGVVHLTLYEYLKSPPIQIGATFQGGRSAALASYMSGYLRMLKNIKVLQPQFFAKPGSISASSPNGTCSYMNYLMLTDSNFNTGYERLHVFFQTARKYELETGNTSAVFFRSIDVYLFPKMSDWRLELICIHSRLYYKYIPHKLQLLEWLSVDKKMDLLIIALQTRLNRYLETELQQNPTLYNHRPLLHIVITLRFFDLVDHLVSFPQTLQILFKYGWAVNSTHQGITAWAHLFATPFFDPFADLTMEFLRQGANPNLIIHEVTESSVIDFINGKLSWNQMVGSSHTWFLPMHLWFRNLKDMSEYFSHRAWDEWKQKLAKLFIEKGANLWMTDSRGETIIEIARDYDPRAAEFLEQCYAAHTGRNSLSSIVSQPTDERCFRIDQKSVAEYRLEPVY